MNSPIPLELPAFLQQREDLAQYALFSDGRLLIRKNGADLSLSPDDLRELRRYFDKFGKDAA